MDSSVFLTLASVEDWMSASPSSVFLFLLAALCFGGLFSFAASLLGG